MCLTSLIRSFFLLHHMLIPTAADLSSRGAFLGCILHRGLAPSLQGLPFVHAGDDLLRSKSLDRDSYNSGDWFNGVDWSGNTHKLGVGLPVGASGSGSGWQ